MMNSPFRNKKNGETYILYGYATNATNGSEGEELCLYFKWKERDRCPHETYVRNKKEFFEKFESISRRELDSPVGGMGPIPLPPSWPDIQRIKESDDISVDANSIKAVNTKWKNKIINENR